MTTMQVNIRSTQSLSPLSISKCRLALAHKIPIFAVVTLRFWGCSISSTVSKLCSLAAPTTVVELRREKLSLSCTKVSVLAVWMRTEYPLLVGWNVQPRSSRHKRLTSCYLLGTGSGSLLVQFYYVTSGVIHLYVSKTCSDTLQILLDQKEYVMRRARTIRVLSIT